MGCPVEFVSNGRRERLLPEEVANDSCGEVYTILIFECVLYPRLFIDRFDVHGDDSLLSFCDACGVILMELVLITVDLDTLYGLRDDIGFLILEGVFTLIGK
jgi:membrane protein CcdC involved in cytochrome C biogenesis